MMCKFTNSISAFCLLKRVKKWRVFTQINSNIIRNFADYPDVGEEYDFLDKYNYVGNRGIYFTHPESSFIIRITDDHDRCKKGNECNDDTCWLYFPKTALSIMTREFNAQRVIKVREALENWKVMQSAPKHHFEWAVGLCRNYASIPNVPLEQKIFAVKHFASTFFTDDIIEQLNSNQNFSSAADELSHNLRNLWSGILDKTTDMNQYRGLDSVPDVYIDSAIRVIEMQTELTHLAKKVLKPEVYKQHLRNCREYLDGCIGERLLFHNHLPHKMYIAEEEGGDVRLFSIGLNWILATNMTDESAINHVNSLNPATVLAAWNTIYENDLVGFCKDKNKDFSPMSFVHRLIQSGQSELEAARNIASKANEIKRVLVHIWQKVPKLYSKHYEYMVLYAMTLTDYNFVRGLRSKNFRYGWIPKLD